MNSSLLLMRFRCGLISSGDSTFNILLQERDIVYGGDIKLEKLLKEADELFPLNKGMSILSECPVGLIGDDINAVAKKMENELDKLVVPCNCEGFRGVSQSLGHHISNDSIRDHIIGKFEFKEEAGPYDVALIGDYNIGGDVWAAKPILEEIGLNVKSVWTGDGEVEKIGATHSVKLNLIHCYRSMNYISRHMEEKYGIPWMEYNFFGPTKIEESLRAIAAQLGRSPSTVSREIQRNGGYAAYRASKAEKAAWERALRPKLCKLASRPALTRVIAMKLQLEWSPEQIAGWLKQRYPQDERYQVSHETIYKSLFIQARGVLKKELLAYLRTERTVRRPRQTTLKGKGLGQIPEAISISERPASIEDRAVPGHWEGDLIAGSNGSHIATLVERHTRYVMLAKVSSKDTETVVEALIKQARKLPADLYKTLTWDRGAEMKGHKKFSLATDIRVFFCDPKSPWQRGSNENTNGLLRQYFPKGTDLSVHSQLELNRVARQLNTRPRKTLDYETPADRFNACVASTG